MTQTQTVRLPSLRSDPLERGALYVTGSDKFHRWDAKKRENAQPWRVRGGGGNSPSLPIGAPTHSKWVIPKGLQPPWYLGQREARGPHQTVCPACRGTASPASGELLPCPAMPWDGHWIPALPLASTQAQACMQVAGGDSRPVHPFNENQSPS